MLLGEVNGYVDAALLLVDAELHPVFGLEAECVLLRLQELLDNNSASISSIYLIPDSLVSTPIPLLLGFISLKFVLIVILHVVCLFPLNALLTLRSFS